ncbi:molybdenum cofactor guanylyltransferase MobA [Thiorhodococcus fuscus]|uniref:Molybdenum cofactor guanylyltransferase n=1 Tax=Thiorhodococcus fuscus TaxID=527200 RepID=A0ABW4Y6T7_9GAMM
MSPDSASTTGVILAGGRARRMEGRDKGLIRLAERPLIEWAIESLTTQVDSIFISANRNLEHYATYGYPVIGDLQSGFQGPLAGCLAAMLAARTDWILTLPCDAPLAPKDLRARLGAVMAAENADLAIASDGHRHQPLHALIRTSLAEDLRGFLDGTERKVDIWQNRHQLAVADFSDQSERFLNINTPADLAQLERTLAADSG